MSSHIEKMSGMSCRGDQCNRTGISRAYRQLRLVSEVLLKDSKKGEMPFRLAANDLTSCESLSRGWKEWTTLLRRSASETFAHEIGAYDKGVRSLFDYACDKCDKEKGQSAVSDWWDRIGSVSGETPPSVLRSLRAYARRVLRVKGVRKGVEEGSIELQEQEWDIPDRNACLERTCSKGGTFSAPLRGCDHPGTLRVAPVKSKGKYRVVTCQPAYVKRMLDRTMKVYYNILSKNSWLVRGDVTVDHFRSLGRCNDKERFVSGDYTASTDYINRDAVMEVVSAMCEGLTEELGWVLMRSFRDTECDGRRIKRGSMMGSKCSFVVLCVINAFVVDGGLNNIDDKGRIVDDPRPKLINGDDSAFRGTDDDFVRWKLYSSWVGLRVNDSKTGRSPRFVEVNSQCYDRSGNYLLPKPSFGFLRQGWSGRFDVAAGEVNPSLWDALFRCLRGLKRHTTRVWVLTHPVVRDALVSSGQSPNVDQIPRRLWSVLVKRAWFRNVAVLGDPMGGRPGLDSPPSRTVSYTYGPVLVDDDDLDTVREMEREYFMRFKKEWDGKPCKGKTKKSVKVDVRRHPAPMRIDLGKRHVDRLWVKEVWENMRDTAFGIRVQNSAVLIPSSDYSFHASEDPAVKYRRDIVITRNDRREFRPRWVEAGRRPKRECWLEIGEGGLVRLGQAFHINWWRKGVIGRRWPRTARLFPVRWV